MNINADLTQRAFADSLTLPWIPSPLAGVDRRMLERDGGEVARATTIVRFAPNKSFSAHSHAKGEEFLVLDGIFSDESGDFGQGMYVRNPPSSKHTPSSTGGCQIFVKLSQMQPEDTRFVRIDTTRESSWKNARNGELMLPLYTDFGEEVHMLRWDTGAVFPEQVYDNGAEFFVVQGGFKDECGTYGEGTWLRLPAGSRQSIQVNKETVVYRKTGHLGDVLTCGHPGE
ncbi:cupin domain-containing protein [Gammaproteobacteria bacterium]|nr:cupin domain-containing protein [Gammaproteobacteria bacterium]